MGDIESLDPEDLLAAPGQLVASGGSHPANPEHDDVEPLLAMARVV